MFIPLKTSKNLCHNGKSYGKLSDPARVKVLRFIRFARNDTDIATIFRKKTKKSGSFQGT
jgi:hypothetical protein